MPQSDKRQSAENTDVQILVVVERIEGKIDRLDDRVKLNSENIETLLDVVTGHKSGGRTGLVVRVHDLENQQDRLEGTLSEIRKVNVRLDTLEDQLSEVLKMQTDHPPLLYLLRFKTRKTIVWLVIIFALLSIIWASDIREAVLSLFGLPGF